MHDSNKAVLLGFRYFVAHFYTEETGEIKRGKADRNDQKNDIHIAAKTIHSPKVSAYRLHKYLHGSVAQLE